MRFLLSDPREGLPPCIVRVAISGVRQATLHRASLCDLEPDLHNEEYKACAGTVGGQVTSHPGFMWVQYDGPWVETDDSTEAQAAFERGAEWVRTGELT